MDGEGTSLSPSTLFCALPCMPPPSFYRRLPIYLNPGSVFLFYISYNLMLFQQANDNNC